MNMIPPVEIILIAIGLIFFVAASRDYIKAGKTISIACKIRLRTGIIFIAVGIGLYIFKIYKW